MPLYVTSMEMGQSVEDMGRYYRIDFSVVSAEPIDFSDLQAYLQRYRNPTTAEMAPVITPMSLNSRSNDAADDLIEALFRDEFAQATKTPNKPEAKESKEPEKEKPIVKIFNPLDTLEV